MSNIEKVIEKIQELIPSAPSKWAELVAEKMGKSKSMVREYARGDKGLRTGGPIEVLKHLKTIIREETERIDELTA